MMSYKSKIDMQALNPISDHVLKYTPPRNSPMQMRPSPVDAKESAPSASISNLINNVTGEASSSRNRD